MTEDAAPPGATSGGPRHATGTTAGSATDSATDSAGSAAVAGERAPAGLSGRRAQAARNDEAILDAAREVFLADAKAPVSAVAERAGVGISALYRRYASKEELLRRLCHDGLRRYLAEAEAAEAAVLAGEDPWTALAGFLERVVDADVHSLTVHLAGTFTPTEEMSADARRAGALTAELLEHARSGGRLRRGVMLGDLELVLEGCAAIRVPRAERTRILRRRYLRLLLDGITAAGEPLPGPGPGPGELNRRWRD
jgi:AcrR family transcriptional regulator